MFKQRVHRVAGEWTSEYRRGKVMEMLVKMAEVLVKIVIMMMAPGSVPAPPEARGREPPFFFFFLDLLPRWEKGFPSGPWSPWCGRGESPSEIGSISLSLSISTFWDSALAPFLLYLEIRNSDWIETFAQIFLRKLAFLRPKKSSNRLTGGMRVRGAPPASWPPRAPSLVDSSSHISQIFQKYSPSIFIPFGLCLIWIFCETKNMQQTGTDTEHWINMLVPKIV